MLPHALILAATEITVPEEGTDDGPAEDDAAAPDEDIAAELIGAELIAEEVIAEDEEPASDAGATAVADEEAGDVEPAAGEAVLAELQALRPTAITAVAAGTNRNRRNISNSPRSGRG